MSNYKDPFEHINGPYRQRLIDAGYFIDDTKSILTEDEDSDDIVNIDNQNSDEQPEDFEKDIQNANFDFPGVNYDLQNEIVTFFTNNPGADPELFREFATSLGIEPDELQLQANILLTQLIDIYLRDAESMGYGDALTADDDIDPEIVRLVSSEN